MQISCPQVHLRSRRQRKLPNHRFFPQVPFARLIEGGLRYLYLAAAFRPSRPRRSLLHLHRLLRQNSRLRHRRSLLQLHSPLLR